MLATHSSILAWKIPWTEEAGRLRPWGRKESDPTEVSRAHCDCYMPVIYCEVAWGKRPGVS